MSDTEVPKAEHDDFPSMLWSFLSNINWKLAIIMFIIGVIIFSDVFINMFIAKIPNTMNVNIVNSKGSVIQLLCYTLSLVLADSAIRGKIL